MEMSSDYLAPPLKKGFACFRFAPPPLGSR